MTGDAEARTDFSVELDGLGWFECDRLSPKTVIAVCTSVLEQLEADYGKAAARLYGLAEILNAWAEGETLDEWWRSRVACSVTLDYFHARVLRKPDKSDPGLAAQISSRSREGPGERLLQVVDALARSQSLPSRWIPKSWLTRGLQDAAANSIRGEMETNLALMPPHAAGEEWALHRSRTEWQTIQAELDQGRPATVSVIEPCWPQGSVWCGIAFDYRLESGGALVEVYDPRREVTTKMAIPATAERSKTPVVLSEAPFEAAIPPGLSRWLTSTHLRFALWRLRRFLHRWRHERTRRH